MHTHKQTIQHQDYSTILALSTSLLPHHVSTTRDEFRGNNYCVARGRPGDEANSIHVPYVSAACAVLSLQPVALYDEYSIDSFFSEEVAEGGSPHSCPASASVVIAINHHSAGGDNVNLTS